MIEVDSLVRQGILYPRWFPDFGQGHGYPIFNFFPPFGYLLTELPALILNDLPLAIQVSMAASMIISGWGMYLLAREIGAGRLASFAVAGFYLYFPYHLQDVYTRGGMPELWAMAWLPWLAWAQLRATREPSVLRIGIAGLLAAAEIGTHNILAAFILPATLGLSLVLSPPKRRFVLASLACSASGVLLATGYWLPAIVEAPLTHVKQLAGDWLPDHTFPVNQLLDGTFFAPFGPKVFKMTALEAGVVLGLLALLLWHGLRSRGRLPQLGLVGMTLAVLFGLTTWSVPLWMNVPLTGYIQFPWRLLILVGFFAAAMLALASSWHRWAWVGVAAVATAVAVASLGQVPDQRFLTPPPLDARSLQTQEYGSALDGVAIESEYQPQTSSPDLMKASQGKRLADDTTSAPPVLVRELSIRPTEIHATVSASQPSRIRLQTLMFPGWQARLDGQPWPLHPATAAGLIEADLPQGRHRLDVTYAGTTLEGIAGLVSGAAILGWLVWLLRRRPLVVAGLLVLTAAVAGAMAHPELRPGRTSAAAGDSPNSRPTAPSPWAASVDQVLVGVDGLRVTVRGIEADLFWQFTAPLEASFDFVLRDSAGREVRRTPASQATTLPYEYVAANELLERRYTLSGPFDLPAGAYTLSAGDHELGQVRLPTPGPSVHRLNVPFQDRATLASYSVDRMGEPPLASRADAAVYPGDFVKVSLLWRSQRTIDQNYVAFVHLIDGSGKTWASHDNQPNATLQATSSWVPGQTIPDQYLLKLPDDVPPGMYRLEVGLYHIDEQGYQFLRLARGGNSVVFGSVKVRPRSAPSAVATPVAQWSEPITLESWGQARQGGDVAFTFDWLAAGEVPRDYTLFVHLSDSDGKVVAQADSPPQRGLYPTSLWDPGDRVTDVHLVSAPPPGRYRLSVGWYRADTGQRLALASGGDELDLGEVEVPSP
ncbi:MAG: 6-pyruvoyl-tetrahydropterin synthase-related protein [Chloroflexota bacterium]